MKKGIFALVLSAFVGGGFAWSHEGHHNAEHGAGGKEVAVKGELVDMAWTFANPDEYWTFLAEVTALGPVVRALPDAAREAVRATINARLEPFTGAGGITLPSQCWGGLSIR